MYCSNCGSDNPDRAKFCRKCGAEIYRPPSYISTDSGHAAAAAPARELTSASPEPGSVADSSVIPTPSSPSPSIASDSPIILPSSVRCASLGDRLVAYFADAVIAYLLLVIVGFSIGVAERIGVKRTTGEFSDTVWNAIMWVGFVIYMILVQAIYHTTIGKYLMGLELRLEQHTNRYPGVGRIILRETVGRVLSSIFWGAGYWTAVRKPQRQAWSDEIAGTVVIKRQTNATLRRAFITFVVIALCVDLGAFAYGTYLEEHKKARAAWELDLDKTGNTVQAKLGAIQKIKGRESGSFVELQANMRQILPLIDEYEAGIAQAEALVSRAERENLWVSDKEKEQFATLQKVYSLRKEAIEKLRTEANLIVEYRPGSSDRTAFLEQLRILDRDMSGLNQQADSLLSQAGLK